jgi:hypothetical protein
MGLDENLVIDKTPERPYVSIRGYDHSRGAEINDWLFAHPECNNYVIIDDRTDFTDEQKEHFVHVDPMWGLTDEHVKLAINVLNHENI